MILKTLSSSIPHLLSKLSNGRYVVLVSAIIQSNTPQYDIVNGTIILWTIQISVASAFHLMENVVC